MPDKPTTPPTPRRKNVVKVELTDDELAMAKVLRQEPEAFVRTAVEIQMGSLRARLEQLLPTT